MTATEHALSELLRQAARRVRDAARVEPAEVDGAPPRTVAVGPWTRPPSRWPGPSSRRRLVTAEHRPAREVVRVRPAGDGTWAVVTVVDHAGGHRHRNEPCARCPYRTDAPLGAFPAQAYRDSAATSYDQATRVFGCHSHPDESRTCAGFLLVAATDNLTVRMAIAAGHLDIAAVRSDVPLYPSYRAMAIANGVSPDDPAFGRLPRRGRLRPRGPRRDRHRLRDRDGARMSVEAAPARRRADAVAGRDLGTRRRPPPTVLGAGMTRGDGHDRVRRGVRIDGAAGDEPRRCSWVRS